MILVTGGAGYVGSAFVRRLLSVDQLAKVLVLDDLSEGHRESLPQDPRLEFVQENNGNSEVLDGIFQTHEVDAVVHFAANAYVGESHEKPFKYFHNNVVNSIKLFEAMENHGVRKLVFSSSCATYGHPQYVPLDEKHPQSPINNYGMTKLMVEQVLQCLHVSKNWRYIALRYFNAAGAALDGSCGEGHDPETHLIPLALQAASGKLPELQILGDDYDTADGSCIRDYVHVTDLADAHILSLKKLESEPVGRAINIGTAHGASVKEVVELCEKVSGLKVPFKIAPRRPGDPPRLVANAALAKSELGWEPKISLEEIIRSAWNWESNRKF